MPPFPGEERLVTLFADCHYYFGEPSARPAVHRFDKASYFYIYWNSTRQTSRIEVANNPGTAEQDAFHGYLDTCRVINSSKFPTLVTLIVDAIDHAPSPVSSKSGRDPEEWRLSSTTDPRGPRQTKYRLHTVDFYFWTQEDAKLVTGMLKKLLHPTQLDLGEPSQPPVLQNKQAGSTGISPIVQNLENVAISDPAYSNGQTRNSQNQPQVPQMSIPSPPPPPPPPPPPQGYQRSAVSPAAAASSPVSQMSHTDSRKSVHSEKPSVDYTPIAYNPAAPAPPEKIAHREKTPPPEDGSQGTGLSGAAMHDQVPPTNYGAPQSWGAPPAASQLTHTSHWGSPPPASAMTGYGSPTTSVGYTSPPSTSQYQQGRAPGTSVAPGAPSFAPPPTTTSLATGQDPHRHSMAAEIYTPDVQSFQQQQQPQPVETPGAEFYSTIQPPAKPLQHVQPQYADYLAGGTKPGAQPPPGGWADYNYTQSGHTSHHSNQEAYHNHGNYEVHNQVYRPTEAEANPHSRKSSRPSRTDTATSSKSSKTSKFLSWSDNKAKKLKEAAERM